MFNIGSRSCPRTTPTLLRGYASSMVPWALHVLDESTSGMLHYPLSHLEYLTTELLERGKRETEREREREEKKEKREIELEGLESVQQDLRLGL